MTAPDDCGCTACKFNRNDPNYPWPPEHVWVMLPDRPSVAGIWWPKYGRISFRVGSETFSTTSWHEIDAYTVKVDVMPRSRSSRVHDH